MSDGERVWRIERTRISTDYQHVTAWSPAVAMETALDGPADKWMVKRGAADDPNATYTIAPVETSRE